MTDVNELLKSFENLKNVTFVQRMTKPYFALIDTVLDYGMQRRGYYGEDVDLARITRIF